MSCLRTRVCHWCKKERPLTLSFAIKGDDYYKVCTACRAKRHRFSVQLLTLSGEPVAWDDGDFVIGGRTLEVLSNG